MSFAKRILVRVKPRSSRDHIIGYNSASQRVEIQVRAAPIKNAANEAMLKLLAGALKVPKSRLRIVSGARSREKLIEIDSDHAIDVSHVLGSDT